VSILLPTFNKFWVAVKKTVLLRKKGKLTVKKMMVVPLRQKHRLERKLKLNNKLK